MPINCISDNNHIQKIITGCIVQQYAYLNNQAKARVSIKYISNYCHILKRIIFGHIHDKMENQLVMKRMTSQIAGIKNKDASEPLIRLLLCTKRIITIHMCRLIKQRVTFRHVLAVVGW